MSKRTQVAIVAAVLVVLGGAVVALAQVNRSDAKVVAGSVAVTRAGSTLKDVRPGAGAGPAAP